MAKTTKAKQKLGPKQLKWLRMLESGKFKQAKDALFNGAAYCCLGVACVSIGMEPDGCAFAHHSADLPPKARRELKFRAANGCRKDNADCLSSMNDLGASFKKIAESVRAEPGQFFTGPA